MTSEQLQAARLEKWRQKANPLLTLEDAAAWIESTGISLFLPRKTQLQTPAPSFVEAVLGEPGATPPPAAIRNAFELAARLFAEEKATPLNLLGTVSEQPDFLVSPEALPYVFALRGDRDWKRGPREKSSPLVVDSWKLLKREGALTTPELQNLLGREVTEAAVLRSLSELWAAMRVLPVYVAGQATAWELFESRHQKAMQIGSGMAQATALSALISLYLDTAIAAASDEIEIFLSPLSPRSRIREVVHGLATTRQLLTIPLGTQNLLHIAGGLPAFPELETPAETPAESEPKQQMPPSRERRPFTQRDKSEREQRFDGPRKPFTPRDGNERAARERPAFADRPAARDARRSSSRSDGPRREWKPRREQGEFRPRREGDKGGFSKPYRSRAGDQPAGEKPPRREEGRGGFSKPYRSRDSDMRTGDQRPYKKFPPRDRDQERPPRKEWKPRPEEGERREFKSRPASGRGFKPKRESGEFGNRQKPTGEKRFGAKRSFEEDRGGFDRRKPPQRERRAEDRDSERPKKSFSRPGSKSGKSFAGTKRSGGPKSFGSKNFESKSGGRKPSFGAKRSSRPGGKPAFGKRPNTRKGKKSSE